MQTRYTNNPTVADICFLDPRFKSLSFYSEAVRVLRERVVKAVEEEGKPLASQVMTEDANQLPETNYHF